MSPPGTAGRAAGDTVVAIDTCDDSIAGFTALVVPGNGTGDGQHYGTGVLPEHRGHGLGRWMKAESIRQARGRYPDFGGLLTDTADSNTHMRHISASLGYVPTRTTWGGPEPARHRAPGVLQGRAGRGHWCSPRSVGAAARCGIRTRTRVRIGICFGPCCWKASTERVREGVRTLRRPCGHGR